MPKVEEGVIVAGRFRLGKKLGQGGMGSVWHAVQIGLDSPCAVKFLDGELGLHPEMIARFEREAKAAAALRSPHVVAIIDHALWEGIPFIAMELLVGENLGDRLERVGRLSVPDTLRVLGEVCRALTKAHQLGIVHRDLKPDNIYIVKDDDREITKVLDFGIAKTTKGLEGSNTRTGAMLGTPYYMSPEQAQGTRAVDFRADLWSMAVIAYLCVTGQLPFQSEALGDLLMKLMVAPLPVPSEVAEVPPGFDAWWVKAASREPTHRFASAKEFIDTLTEALYGVSQGSTLVDVPVANPNATSPNTLASANVSAVARVQTGPGLGGGTQMLGSTPQPAVIPPMHPGTPMPQMSPLHPGTPQPQMSPHHPGTPQPQMSPVHAGTPQPQMSPPSGSGQFGTTPSPTSQTFADAAPPKKAPIGAILAIAGVFLVFLIGGGAVLARVVGARSGATHDVAAASATGAMPSATTATSVAEATTATAVTGTTPSSTTSQVALGASAGSVQPGAGSEGNGTGTTPGTTPGNTPGTTHSQPNGRGQPQVATAGSHGKAGDPAKPPVSAAVAATTAPVAPPAASSGGRRDFGF